MNEVIRRLRETCEGFGEPASEAALLRLAGALPDGAGRELLALYRDHDGSAEPLSVRGHPLAARLMSIEEALETTEDLADTLEGEAPGTALWAWADDQSNYAGVFTSGPLTGFVTVLDHEEPRIAPRFRSPAAFVDRLLECAEVDDAPFELTSVPCELPAVRDEKASLERHHALAAEMLTRWRGARGELGDDLRRSWARAAMCLLPVADMHLALDLLSDPDMWTPEEAVNLFELRGFRAAVPALEKLALSGRPNGDGAAMRALVRFGTPEAKAAVARLERSLTGQKLAMLDMWRRVRLQPPRW
jgi:hypothetical protein